MAYFARVRGHTIIPALLPEGCTVVDLGANHGDFSRLIGERFGWECYCVEASPETYSKIADGPRLRKFNLAIADRDGPVALCVAANSEESSIIGAADAAPGGQVTVEGIRLETFVARAGIRRIDLLKVDIEGAEGYLFDSLGDGQIQEIRQISLEFHDFNGKLPATEVKRITEKLVRLGFEPLKMSVFTNGDTLFVNRRLCGVSRAQIARRRLLDRNVIFLKRLLYRKILPKGRRRFE